MSKNIKYNINNVTRLFKISKKNVSSIIQKKEREKGHSTDINIVGSDVEAIK